MTKLELCEDLIYFRGLGYTQQEISEELGIPRRTVGRKLEELKDLHRTGKISVSIGVRRQ